MIKKINKKGAIPKTLVGIIVAFLVVGLVFGLLYTADVLKYLRNIIPDFSSDDSQNSQTTGQNPVVPENCEKIAEIGKPEGGTFGIGSEQYIYVNNQKTKLYLEEDNKIMLDKSYSDGEIGEVINFKLIIKSIFLDESSQDYIKYKSEGLPELKTLEMLNGSQYVSGNLLCKTKQEFKKIEISEEELLNIMNYFSSHEFTGYSGEKKSCVCDDKCGEYSEWIYKYSKEYGVNPVLFLALMMQESDCDERKASQLGAVGLMQLTRSTVEDENTGCIGSRNIGVDFNDVKTSSEKNIQCGIWILISKYKAMKQECDSENDCSNPFSGSVLDKCNQGVCEYFFKACGDEEYYSSWDAALRAYNGWGDCREGTDSYFVDRINIIQNKLTEVNV